MQDNSLIILVMTGIIVYFVGIFHLTVKAVLIKTIATTLLLCLLTAIGYTQTFTKVSSGAIVNDGSNTRSCAWGDYDGDGDLDVYITVGPASIANLQGNNLFYQNNCNGGFTRITGIDPIKMVQDATVGASNNWIDLDNDGDLDLFVANIGGTTTDFLYLNNGDGTFQDASTTNIVAGGTFSRDNFWADFNNDGAVDLLIIADDGGGSFTKTLGDPLVSGANSKSEGGSAWGDFDNDGDLDVIIGNNGANQFFRNNGNGTFTQITTGTIATDMVTETKGLTWVDYDNDGDLDLFIATTFGGPDNILYENNGNANHFIDVKLTGETTNASAMGARIFVYTTIFGSPVSQMREVITNVRGVQPFNQHFGLGDATNIDSLIVVWPSSGTTQKFFNVSADRFIEIEEGNNTILPVVACKPEFPPVNPGVLQGTVFADLDSNCTFVADPDYLIPNKLVQALPGPNFVLTDVQGNYEFRLAPDDYAVSQVIETGSIFSEEDCPLTDSIYFVSVLGGDTTANNDFFNLQQAAPCDVIIDITLPGDTAPCPGQTHEVCVTFDNNGPAIQDPEFVITTSSVPAGATVVTSSVTASAGCNCTPILVGNTITCTNPGIFPASGVCTICFDVDVPGFFTTNDLITTNATMTDICQNSPFSEDSSRTDTTDCAVDPNDKLVAPEGCGPFGNIARGEELIYQVRFQNTGTAAAGRVEIRDVLDSDFDITTFRLMATSHAVTRVEIIPDHALILTFDNINLPDSGTSLAGSKGFVVFGITPQTGLPDGTEITNQAGIYFDRNDVVLTNTTLNTIRDNPFPIVDFDAGHSCTSTGLVFDFTYTGGTSDGATFDWDFGANASPSTSTDENPTGIMFSSTGLEQINLVVTRFGCVDSTTKTLEVEDVSCGNNKVLICHIPPGNPENPQTICVSQSALQAHLDHGDCIGACVIPLAKMGGSWEEDEGKGIDETAKPLVVNLQLQVIPNPVTDKAAVRFLLPKSEDTKLRVYNYLGQTIATLYNNPVKAGQLYSVEFSTEDLPAGVYFAVLESGNSRIFGKVLVTRGP